LDIQQHIKEASTAICEIVKITLLVCPFKALCFPICFCTVMSSSAAILILYGAVLLKLATSTTYTPYAYLILDANVNTSVANYLQQICMPLVTNLTRATELHLNGTTMINSLALSPFPCEQQLYLGSICQANATDEVDFLAEQECLCGGSFFEVSAGCNACLFSHGYTLETPEEASSSLSSLSTAECNPTPPFQPFRNLLPSPNVTHAIQIEETETLGHDQFPNKTDVSYYFTATGSVTDGAITGSATARLTSPISYPTAWYWTPTAISRTGTSTGVVSSSPVAPPSKNGAMGKTAGFDAGLLGIGLIFLVFM
jgi:hypothetical protein